MLSNFRVETPSRDVGAHASRRQRGQCIAFNYRIYRGRTLQAGFPRVSERNRAFPRGGGGLFCQRLFMCSIDQSFAAALREDPSYQ